MHFFEIDLMHKLKPLPQEHQYGLSIIHVMTNYIWCILLHTKEADNVVHTYLVIVYSKFGGSHYVLSHNGTGFENKLFTQIASILAIKQIYSLILYCQGNGCIENIHNFLKSSICKQVCLQLAWDEVACIACAAYNLSKWALKRQCILPVFGRDVYTLLL